jgi:hypothetical protein
MNKSPDKKTTPSKKLSISSISQKENKKMLTSVKKKKINKNDFFSTSVNEINQKNLKSAETKKNTKKESKNSFSNDKNIFKISEEGQIDTKKLDEVVDKIFEKFVRYYCYEDIFYVEKNNLADLTENSEINSQNLNKSDLNQLSQSQTTDKENVIDFDLKLNTIFNIYKIKKSPEHNLISNSEEGSYLLKHAKIWIIYIKNLKETFNFKYSDLHTIFNFSLEYDCDEYLLFDYFLTLAQEYEEDEILEFSEDKVPMKFIQIYNQNKDHILKTLKEDEEADAIEERNNLNLSFSNDNENIITKNEHEFSFSAKKDYEAHSDIQENKKNNCQEKSVNIFNFNCNDEISPVNDEKEETLNYLNSDFIQNSDEETNITNEFPRYLATPQISIIQERSNESEQTPLIITNKKKFFDSNNKENLIALNSLSKYYKPYESSYSVRKINLPNTEGEQANIIEPDIRSSGNFAVLELTSKSQEKIKHKYVLTPLKKQFSNIKERSEADKDLKEIHKEYSDFIFHPYDSELISKIEKTAEKARKLSFSNLDEVIFEKCENKEKVDSQEKFDSEKLFKNSNLETNTDKEKSLINENIKTNEKIDN